eukprot:9013053-Pyramimonas_sp.AAC.1
MANVPDLVYWHDVGLPGRNNYVCSRRRSQRNGACGTTQDRPDATLRLIRGDEVLGMMWWHDSGFTTVAFQRVPSFSANDSLYGPEKISWRRTQPSAIVRNALWVPLSVGLRMGPQNAAL